MSFGRGFGALHEDHPSNDTSGCFGITIGLLLYFGMGLVLKLLITHPLYVILPAVALSVFGMIMTGIEDERKWKLAHCKKKEYNTSRRNIVGRWL